MSIISTQQQHVILFYKYTPLSTDLELMEKYRSVVEALCRGLNLSGRLLIGTASLKEGFNGTFAGTKVELDAFVTAFGPNRQLNENVNSFDETFRTLIEEYWKQRSSLFIDQCGYEHPPTIDEFKWSVASNSKQEQRHYYTANSNQIFPDLRIRLVKELINTGGRLDGVTLDDVGQGYLTPKEWHEEMLKYFDSSSSSEQLESSDSSKDEKNKEKAILIDCRNHKEFSIGHFNSSVDPHTRTFAEFFDWVDKHKVDLEKKEKVFMYCTGGIRCEKASAYIRSNTNAKEVYHLQGGIHKYLEEFGNQGTFKGKNFVFDSRLFQDVQQQSSSEAGTTGESSQTNNTTSEKQSGTSAMKTIGKCVYCFCPWDQFLPNLVCTVCRELVLVCSSCQKGLKEIHCVDHQNLRTCYFTDLSRFSLPVLREQLEELEEKLEEIAVGRKFKNKRRSLQKQIVKVQSRIIALESGESDDVNNQKSNSFGSLLCRSCGTTGCDGSCWGFHGLQRKTILENNNNSKENNDANLTTDGGNKENSGRKRTRTRQASNQRQSKLKKKEQDINEIQYLVKELGLATAREQYHHDGMICIPPYIRQIQTASKGRWCGQKISTVLQENFAGFSDEKINGDLFVNSLIKFNGNAISLEEAENIELKNMDTISRICCWHEPPVLTPSEISISKVKLQGLNDEGEESSIFCCDKPSTVPVHPSGPYLLNSLSIMVEIQEGLKPRSLLPCHRLDRVTSGLVLFATSANLAQKIQSCMHSSNGFEKVYIARVNGHFPETGINFPVSDNLLQAEWKSDETDGQPYVDVTGAIDILDINVGKRGIVKTGGKRARSVFRLIRFDETSYTSIIACSPVTGRSHQLRVHLSALGYPICNDSLYGGKIMRNSRSLSTKHLNVVDWLKRCKRSYIKNVPSHLQGVTMDDIESASNMCPSCCSSNNNTYENSLNDGINTLLSPSQLLADGQHAIDLHATKYKLQFVIDKGQGKKEVSVVNFECPSKPDFATCQDIDKLRFFSLSSVMVEE